MAISSYREKSVRYPRVAVNGQPLFAEVDTGSESTSFTREAARNAGVNLAKLDREPEGAVEAATGPVVKMHRHSFQSLRAGAVTLSNVKLNMDDTVFAEVDVLLGVDFLRDARLWLSYATSQVFMQ